MSLLVTGATGFVGRRFVESVGPSGVVGVSRNSRRANHSIGEHVERVIEWDPLAGPYKPEPDASPVTQVVNLMGESIAEGRWTKAKKKRVYDSRVVGTRNLVDGLIRANTIPKVMVSASAIGIYGDPGEEIVEEDHQLDDGFTGQVCRDWEAEAMRLADHGSRVVCLRIGIVIGPGGGAVEKMLPIFRWGLGGKLGSGKQWMAWVHVDDLVAMIGWCLKSPIAGPVNATAPNPIRNSTFTKSLAVAVGKPAFLPVPWFALRAALGEFANTLFFSQRVVPSAATKHGFEFKFPEIGPALQDSVSQS